MMEWLKVPDKSSLGANASEPWKRFERDSHIYMQVTSTMVLFILLPVQNTLQSSWWAENTAKTTAGKGLPH